MKRALAAAVVAAALAVLLAPVRAQAAPTPPTTPSSPRWVAGPTTNYGLWDYKVGELSVYLPEADASLNTQMVFRETPDAIAYGDVDPASFWAMGPAAAEAQDRPGYVRLIATLTRVWSAPTYVSVWTTAPDGTHSAPLRWTLGPVTQSATLPGPREDLTPEWDTTTRTLGVAFP